MPFEEKMPVTALVKFERRIAISESASTYAPLLRLLKALDRSGSAE
jgi:hypothetical protein